MAVGSHSAEECHQKYTEEQQTKASKRHATKTTTSGKPEQKGTDLLAQSIILFLPNFKFSVRFAIGEADTSTHIPNT